MANIDGSFWVWVSMRHATFGLLVRDGKIVEAPPIARWTIGKSDRYVADYFRSKGAKMRRL